VRRLAVAGVVLVAILAAAGPASAHNTLDRSDPRDGGAIAVGRTTLTLWFAERIGDGTSAFDLRSLDGTKIRVTVVDPADRDRGFVQLRTKPLERGAYALDWAVVSLEDGHPSRGTVRFGVGTRTGVVVAGAATLPGPFGFVVRWLDLAALVLLIGGMAVAGRVLTPLGAAAAAPLRRARAIARVAVLVTLVTGAVMPFVRTPRTAGSPDAWLQSVATSLTATTWGHLWMARELAIGVVAVSLALGSRSSGSRSSLRGNSAGSTQIATVGLAAVVALEAWSGHASTLARQSGLAGIASAFHLVAAGVWAGGLVVLAACLLRPGDPHAQPVVAAAWRRFGRLAAVATIVLLATGLYETGRHVPALAAIGSTVYGGAVAAKLVVLVAALGLAAVNTMLVNRRIGARVGRLLGRARGWSPVSPRRFAVVVAVEATTLVAALAGAALLTSVPTAAEASRGKVETTPQVAIVDGVFLTFEAVPGAGDRTRLIVRTRSLLRPDPGPVTAISLRLAGPGGMTRSPRLVEIEPGRYEGETASLGSGAWRARLTLARARYRPAVTQLEWAAAVARPDAMRRLEVVLTILAVLLLAALAAAFGVRGLRRRRPIPQSRVETRSP
jgi:copper transport protein